MHTLYTRMTLPSPDSREYFFKRSTCAVLRLARNWCAWQRTAAQQPAASPYSNWWYGH